MFCPNCGKENADGSKFCVECGSRLSADTITAVPSMQKLIISRKKVAAGSAVKTEVKIDGISYGKIRNGGSIEIELPSGTHRLYLKSGMNTETEVDIIMEAGKDLYYPIRMDNFGATIYDGADAKLIANSKESTKQNTKESVVITIVFILAIILLFSFMISDMKDDAPQENKPVIEETQPVFVPVTQNVGSWEVTINDYSYNKKVSAGLLHEYSAADGSTFLLVNVTATNIGKESNTFLPYFAYTGDSIASVSWKGYKYTRSELAFSGDNLSSETMNPLVSATGTLAFEVPEEMVTSEENPVLNIKDSGKTMKVKLFKEILETE